MSIPPFVDLPNDVARVEIPTPSGPIAALEIAPPHPRGTVLLVPGFTGSKEDFIALLPGLGELGWRAVAIDQRGQFESKASRPMPPPQDGAFPPHDEVLVEAATAVLEVATGLGGRVHLVGHSFGGLVSRRAVLLQPSAFASLTLVGSGPGQVPEPQWEGLEALRQGMPFATLEMIWDIKDARDRELGLVAPDPEIHEFLRTRFLNNDPWHLVAFATALLDETDRVEELSDACSRHGIPALVITGEADDVWSPEVQRDMARRLRATWALLPHCAHSPAAERPEEVVSTLETHMSLAQRESGREFRPALRERSFHPSFVKSRVEPVTGGYPDHMRLCRQIAPDPRAVGEARHFLAASLTVSGQSTLVDDAVLVASELVTNALRHARSPIEMHVLMPDTFHSHQEGIRIEVCDSSTQRPVELSPTPESPGGRGLQLVSRIADRWGHELSSNGKVVWAEFDSR